MEMPLDWTGTRAEWEVYAALSALDEDFEYASPHGGILLDFFLPKRSLALNIRTPFPAYGIEKGLPEQLTTALGKSWGIDIIYLDEDDIMKDPNKVVKEALDTRW